MDLNTKYWYTDVVYFMQDNEICTGFIYEIRVKQSTLWAMQLHHFKKNDGGGTSTQTSYKICLDSYNIKGTDWIPEQQCFETEADLIQSLTK